MEHQIKESGSDVLLVPFLEATSESIADELLVTIVENHAEPIIRRILRGKLRVSLNDSGTQQNQDALEIAGDLRATIISILRTLRANLNQNPIVNFPDFVAIKAYSACADYFREKHPQRWRLKNLLRRHLRQNPQFALWQAEDHRWYAAFSGQRDASKVSRTRSGEALSNSSMQPDGFLTELFEHAQGPIDFEEVVRIAAETWRIQDRPMESIDDGIPTLSSPAPGVDFVIEQRLLFEQVWNEVCQLPVLQRAALLLNLRDSRDGGVISFLPVLGIASKHELARLLEMRYEDFLGIWTELPLDDLRIAKLLGVTRQQVINLRKTARERLVRRMQKLQT